MSYGDTQHYAQVKLMERIAELERQLADAWEALRMHEQAWRDVFTVLNDGSYAETCNRILLSRIVCAVASGQYAEAPVGAREIILSTCPNCKVKTYRIPDINGVPPWMPERWEEVERKIDATPPRYRCPKCGGEFPEEKKSGEYIT